MNTVTTPNGTPYLIWSIAVTALSLLSFCFCFPLIAAIPGIVAIVFAAQVNGKVNQGDLDGAARAVKAAKLWCIVASILFVLAFAAYFIALAAFGGAAGMEEFMEQYRQQMEQ